MSRNLIEEYVNQETFKSMTIRKIHGTMAELLEISCYIDGGQTIGVIRFFHLSVQQKILVLLLQP